MNDHGAVFHVRCDPELLRALDAEAQRVRESNPGIRTTRSDVAGNFILSGLAPKAAR